MTRTRSARSTASSTECVTKITVNFVLCQISINSSCSFAACQRVECAERFIHQKKISIVGENPRDGYALFHAAGKLIGIAVGKCSQSDHRKKPFGRRVNVWLSELRDGVDQN